jgi:hypothetical protein
MGYFAGFDPLAEIESDVLAAVTVDVPLARQRSLFTAREREATVTVVSQTLEVAGNGGTVDVKPTGGGDYRVTGVVTDQSLGLRFRNDDGDNTSVVLKNKCDFDMEMFVSDSDWFALETTGPNTRTGFVSLEVE